MRKHTANQFVILFGDRFTDAAHSTGPAHK